MTDQPKFKIGDEVIWKGSKYRIEAVRNYQNYCWVYDFEKTKWLSISKPEMSYDRPIGKACE